MKANRHRADGAGIDLATYQALFVTEARSFIAILRSSLIHLQDGANDGHDRHEALRAAHTLKGMSATMGMEDMATLAQRMENSLLAEASLTQEQTDGLLMNCDQFEQGLQQLEN